MIEMLEDIEGLNDEGVICYPFKGQQGDKKGFYSYTFSSDNKTFQPATEAKLRQLIETGEFADKGRIRMVPKGATSTAQAGAMKVQNYKGKPVR